MSHMVGVNSLKRGVRLWAGLIQLWDRGQLADSCENDEILGPMNVIKSRQFFLNNWATVEVRTWNHENILVLRI